jgi:hypothetical protein
VGSIPDEVIGFLKWPNPSNRTMALGSTQPLTEMSTKNLPGGKGRPARGADDLTAICEPTVYKMWEPRRLTTLGPSWPVTGIALLFLLVTIAKTIKLMCFHVHRNFMYINWKFSYSLNSEYLYIYIHIYIYYNYMGQCPTQPSQNNKQRISCDQPSCWISNKL